MGGWLEEQMSDLRDEWMDGWMDGRTDERKEGCIHGWMLMEGFVDGGRI